MRVSLFGAGQVSANVAQKLASQRDIEVEGPFGRSDRAAALDRGADVVVIATTSFLEEVGPDIRRAVTAGSNVLTTAEEAAYPWHFNDAMAQELDALARQKGVSILGAGLNPGFAFDAMVVTASGLVSGLRSIKVERVVDLSGFSITIQRRLGIGYSPEDFQAGVKAGAITGHIGFPQSMRIVARKMGVTIDRIDSAIEPLVAESPHELAQSRIEAGQTAGVLQRYTALAGSEPWFEAQFFGHIDPESTGHPCRDEIFISSEVPPLHLFFQPGINPQVGSSSIIANSVRRLAAAGPGWLTVADLPPAWANSAL